jgi:hypothetical protein
MTPEIDDRSRKNQDERYSLDEEFSSGGASPQTEQAHQNQSDAQTKLRPYGFSAQLVSLAPEDVNNYEGD